ncbi:hypothetical protein GXP70_13360 [Paenibacillus lycopersici]|uniref:Uncharacterized protein n=1 Tax=Paenibacillus lycopersici TaxID=2704462 RepID=A0A6C0G0V0_9BACL|nr:hypothetical protein [Paenibacillus lycopersici]QHT60839.1 hypothetical protein GXP70_13360 [Paenibacillus lycopersici]
MLEQQLYRHYCRSVAGKVARTATLPAFLPARGGKSCSNSNFTGTFTGQRREKLLEQQLYRHYCRSVAGKVARIATFPALLPVRGGKSCSNSNFSGIFTGQRREKLPEQQLYRHVYRPEAGKVARTATLPTLLPVRGGKSCSNSNFTGMFTGQRREKLPEQQLYRYFSRSDANKVVRIATFRLFVILRQVCKVLCKATG